MGGGGGRENKDNFLLFWKYFHTLTPMLIVMNVLIDKKSTIGISLNTFPTLTISLTLNLTLILNTGG